jgi:hypothetical protein
LGSDFGVVNEFSERSHFDAPGEAYKRGAAPLPALPIFQRRCCRCSIQVIRLITAMPFPQQFSVGGRSRAQFIRIDSAHCCRIIWIVAKELGESEAPPQL